MGAEANSHANSRLVGWSFEPVDAWPFDPEWRVASWNGRDWTSHDIGVPPSTGLVLTWRAHVADSAAVAFDIAVRTDRAWTPWTPIGTWGEASMSSPIESPISVNVDTAMWQHSAKHIRVRARAMGDVGLRRVVASCFEKVKDCRCLGPPSSCSCVQDVPFRSQMVESPDIAKRICGPASLAMYLATIDASIPTADIAGEAYDRVHDIYGNWARLAAVAGDHGFIAWVERFSCLNEVETRVAAGYGAILSIAFEQGDLDGAALDRTDGHLVVLRGWDGSDFSVVNDPAFATGAGDGVRYHRDQLEKVWKRHGGVAIMLRPERGGRWISHRGIIGSM